MLVPPKLALPKNVFGHSGDFFFFLNSLQPDNRKIYIPYNLFHAITLFSAAANVLKYYIFLDSILDRVKHVKEIIISD